VDGLWIPKVEPSFEGSRSTSRILFFLLIKENKVEKRLQVQRSMGKDVVELV
jgi:hypothetical protein